MRDGNRVRKLLRRVGWLGVAVSVALGGYTAWRYFDPLAAGRQAHARAELQQDWLKGRDIILPGRPFATIHIPRLWGTGSFAVIEGVTDQTLGIGPAHFSGTALPGDVGNFAIAGHTVGGNDPFLHMSTIIPGDKIVVDTRTQEFVYTVSRAPFRIKASDVGILDPVPNNPGQVPSEAQITVVSCVWPEHMDDTRTIAQGTLSSTTARER